MYDEVVALLEEEYPDAQTGYEVHVVVHEFDNVIYDDVELSYAQDP